MSLLRRSLRGILLVGTGFLAVTAIPGGAMLVLGLYTPPESMLEGSLFKSFLLPGIALALVVGGSALLAATSLLRRRPSAIFYASLSGIVVMAFEFVQVVSIGSPAGPSRVMQVTYFGLGFVLATTGLLAYCSAPGPTA